jgi:hypothetical protein
VRQAIDSEVPARGFHWDLGDPGIALAADMLSDSRTLLLAFGGMVGRIGIPPFEFFSLTEGIPVKRLFVRDPSQAWYHRGIPGHGSTLLELAQSLKRRLARERVERLIVAGNSAGGYAALVFGTLLGADIALCFAPQTVLDLNVLATMGDHRWDDRLTEQTAAGAIDARFTDLTSVLSEARRARSAYRIYFDTTLRPDRLHAERLSGLQGVRLYRFGQGSHSIARALRDSGALRRVLRQALDTPHVSQSEAKFGHSPTSISGWSTSRRPTSSA